MTISPAFRDFLWATVGAVIFLGVALLAMNFYEEPDRTDQILLKAKRVELVGQMRQALVSASEAEKSAVLATTDQESQAFANETRAASAAADQGQRALRVLLDVGGTEPEKELLDRFLRGFTALNRIDDDLLALAVRNTNLKAYGLAFGPAATALEEVDHALSRIVEKHVGSTSPDAKQVMLLASRAEAAALRIQTLLPPHIAEESDRKMDELEALMTMEDQKVHEGLDGLFAHLKPRGDPDLEMAVTSYARFSRLRADILKLSRENTNVRSLAISLNQKRKAMLACQAALTALEQTIEEEPAVRGSTPVNPRKP